MAAGDDAAVRRVEGHEQHEQHEPHIEDETALPEPKHVAAQEKQTSPAPEPPEADEFGLPTRPPRRREYSLDEPEGPENPGQAIPSPTERPDGTKEVAEPAESTAQAEERKHGEDGVAGPPGKIDTGSEPNHANLNPSPTSPRKSGGSRPSSSHTPQKPSAGATSEWSHQQLAPHAVEEEHEENEEQWQDMPAYTEHRTFDDWGKVIAKGYDEMDDEAVVYGKLGGAGKGYTRVQMDEDAQSATSLDDNTAYLFRDQYARNVLDEDDEEGRDLVSQMQTTKELLTEGQKIAYVGVVRLAINTMAHGLEGLERGKGSKKAVDFASEGLKMWGQKIMMHIYTHMDITGQEQIMVEQLADHGVVPSDLTHTLMQNARVNNPQAQQTDSVSNSATTSARPSVSSPRPSSDHEKARSATNLSVSSTPVSSEADPPPAYQEHSAGDLTIQDPSELTAKSIDLDIRWTVLCDLFLLLIKDGHYDSRSRTLLELVGSALSVDWQEICRFEKRVTDALEMQEQAEKENWNEDEHLKSREQRARKRRLMVMGLCTVGGGLVIGLSAGMLAPVIGAGLAAGFTGIGITGTGTFLGGTGAAALIGTTGTLIGGHIGMKGSHRRTGAVKTFEYRPLYNNKRVNLIVTVSGWMTGKVDDVRLPFSTVDPIMGDIYSVNWEPEMLQSTGQTIQILGTEALTQSIQQILGATFLATLMAGLSLPIVLTKLAYVIDNPWTVSLARADSAGLILADSLIDRNLGVRPVTLVGFSLGSRVIFSCLKELARRGAVGLVQNVYLFGSPVVVKKDEWTKARTVVSGRFVNGYATNDWILAYLFRATSGGIMRVAGLATVDIHGIENFDITEHVPGHMAYRGMMPTLLHEVGWLVNSVEFTEIEDPDPDNHEKRQRELITEIEEARRELEGRPEKKGWKNLFTRKKAPQKKEWETYDERSTQVLHGEDAAESERIAAESDVMFDVEAIRREALSLALEGGNLDEIKAHMSIREIQSTMPALKIDSPKIDSPKIDSPKIESPKQLESPPSGSAVDASSSGTTQQTQTRGDTSSLPNGMTNGHHSDDEHDSHDDSNITMTFESPDHDHPAALSRTPSHWDNLYRKPSPSESTMPAHTPSPQSKAPASTVPGYNPWDAEDGKEKEVEMSFE